MAALRAMLAISPAPQMQTADVMSAELSVRHAIHEERAAIVGDYFLMYDIGKPWYSAHNMLIEDIVLKFRSATGNKVETAVAALEEIAKQRGCTYIAVGDTQIGYMGHKYVAAGYELMGQQFLKGPLHGIPP